MGKPQVNYKIINIDSLNKLTDIERKVIEMRLGLGIYFISHTINEIVKLGGFSNRDTVRRIEKKAIKKLRESYSKCRIIKI